MSSAAATQSACTSPVPSAFSVRMPMRSCPKSAPTSSANGRAGAGAMTVSPGNGVERASSAPATSRTERASTSSQFRIAVS